MIEVNKDGLTLRHESETIDFHVYPYGLARPLIIEVSGQSGQFGFALDKQRALFLIARLQGMINKMGE
jgi:hypothetical protein